MKILLIEDDPDTAGYVANGLRENSHLPTNQRRAATPAEADGHDDDLTNRERTSRGVEQAALTEVGQVAFQERRAVGKMGFENRHVGK